jgi:hypothetical protein
MLGFWVSSEIKGGQLFHWGIISLRRRLNWGDLLALLDPWIVGAMGTTQNASYVPPSSRQICRTLGTRLTVQTCVLAGSVEQRLLDRLSFKLRAAKSLSLLQICRDTITEMPYQLQLNYFIHWQKEKST